MSTDGNKKYQLGINRESEEASLFGKKCYTEDTDNLGSCSHLVMVKIAASDVLRWYKLLADLRNQNRNPFRDQIPFAFKTCLQRNQD